MARLHKKKAAGTKKKKKLETGGDGAIAVSGGAAVKSAASPVAAKEVRRAKTPPARKSAGAKRAEPGKIRGWFDTAAQFLREVKVELKKVTWPSRKQTMGSTAVVIVLVMIISFFLGIADIGLRELISVVLR